MANRAVLREFRYSPDERREGHYRKMLLGDLFVVGSSQPPVDAVRVEPKSFGSGLEHGSRRRCPGAFTPVCIAKLASPP